MRSDLYDQRRCTEYIVIINLRQRECETASPTLMAKMIPQEAASINAQMSLWMALIERPNALELYELVFRLVGKSMHTCSG